MKLCFNVIVAGHTKSLPDAILVACNLLQFVAICCGLLRFVGTCEQFLEWDKNPVTKLPGSFLSLSTIFSKAFVCDLSGGQIDFKQYISYFDGL